MRYQWLKGVSAGAALLFSTPAFAQTAGQDYASESPALSLSAAVLLQPAPPNYSTASAAPQAARTSYATASAALKWEMAYLGLSAIDAVQTIYCLERRKCTDANPIFGKRPSTETIIIAKLVGSGVQFALFNEVLKKDPKVALRVAQISFALQGTVVALNARVVF